MGKMPQELRQTIANNIRNCRLLKYPGRGGGKKCAENFGVSPQQWSPWERGMRTPDELRLKEIADFFGVTVGFLRGENILPSHTPPLYDKTPPTGSQTGDVILSSHFRCPFYTHPQPGQPFAGHVRSLCWLAEQFFGDIQNHGIRIRLHSDDVELIIERLASLIQPQHS